MHLFRMPENLMSMQRECAVSGASCNKTECTSKQQQEFDGLQVNRNDEHDKKLVDARMLGVVSSTESRQTTIKSSDISTRRNSDYSLQRFMASFDKLGSFLQRHQRAKTAGSEDHVLSNALPRSNTT